MAGKLTIGRGDLYIECDFRYSPKLYKVKAIMSILKLSVFLEVKDSEDWALTELPQISAFSPSLKLEVA